MSQVRIEDLVVYFRKRAAENAKRSARAEIDTHLRVETEAKAATYTRCADKLEALLKAEDFVKEVTG
jgi:hypothetical protein